MFTRPKSLRLYLYKTFLGWFVMILIGLSFLIFLVELIEVLRRTADKPGVSLQIAAALSSLRIAQLLLEVMPLIILVAAIGCLWWRSRSNELIVARATGLSIWQFLRPLCLSAFFIGLFCAGIGDPLVTKASEQRLDLEAQIFGAKTAQPRLRVSSTGIWLKENLQDDETQAKGYRLLRALKFSQDDDKILFESLDLYRIEQEGDTAKISTSWHAAKATLFKGQLTLSHVEDTSDPLNPVAIGEQSFETSIRKSDLYTEVEAVPNPNFWETPSLIETRKRAAKGWTEIELKYNKLLAMPVALVAMVLLAALFSLRMARSGGVGLMIISAVVIAIMLHFLSDVLYSFALSGALPVQMTAWFIPLCLATTCLHFLLRYEDG